MAEFDSDDEPVEEEPAVEITQPMTLLEPTEIAASSPKKYIKAALSVGFEVRAGETETVQKREPFKSGKREGEAQSDLVKRHLWVSGKHAAGCFKLYFVNNRFADALVWDTAGWPTELYFDYTPRKSRLKRVKDEPEWAWKERIARMEADAKRLDHENNDGVFWTNTAPRLVTTGKDLDEWFADMVPGFKVPKPRKKKDQDAAAAVDLMQIEGEWIG